MTPALVKPGAYGVEEILSLQPIEIRTGLLRGRAQHFKRALDVVLAVILGIVAVPVGLVIALAIALESRGPVFFGHTRVGRGRRRFRLWKFRSMVENGDEILRRHLDQHPERALEWRLGHKLRNDPRVTRVGRFLRRTSLDELPQLWNVLRGDMSMIGPRPIVEEEIPKYGAAIALYSEVAPGLTGLWQVSGRNDVTYRQRVELDTHYIRRWTPGQDLVVLLKTVRVVLGGRGAY
jgi:Undecaprenyl-phosphate galactose phosphotransferase WbaP